MSRYYIPRDPEHDSIMMTKLFDADIENEYRFVGDSDWRFATLFATTRPRAVSSPPPTFAAPLLFWMGASKADLHVIIRILCSFFSIVATADQIENARSFPIDAFLFLVVVIANV